MKINSENLWNYVNNLATNERVKFDVYYDDEYLTQVLWNGDKFEWESGLFTSEAFFNPLYDFKEVEEEKKIPEKLELKDNWCRKKGDYSITDYEINPLILNKINEICDYLKSKGE